MQLLAHLVGRERQEVNLDVRRRKTRIGLEKRPRRACRDRQRAAAKSRISRAGQDPANRIVDDIVECDALGTTRDQPDLQMVLQIVTDARRIEHHVDAVSAQQLRWTDAG